MQQKNRVLLNLAQPAEDVASHDSEHSHACASCDCSKPDGCTEPSSDAGDKTENSPDQVAKMTPKTTFQEGVDLFIKAKVVMPIAVTQLIKLSGLAEDPDNIFYIRVFFVLMTLITFNVRLAFYKMIKQKNDATEFTYKKGDLKSKSIMSLFGEETAEGGDDEEVTQTVCQYDMALMENAMLQMFPQLFILGVMHLKFNYVTPLVASPIMNFFGLVDSHLIRLHLFGFNESSDPSFKRPFRSNSVLGDLMKELSPEEETQDPTQETQQQTKAKEE